MKTTYGAKRTYRKKTVSKAKRSFKKTKATVSKTVKAYVKRTIHASEENKTAMVDTFVSSAIVGGQIGGFGTGLTSPEILSNFNIGQGAAQNQRIGNCIRPVRIQLRGVLRSALYNVTTNPYFAPVEVHMFIYKLKNNFTSSLSTGLLQNGVQSVPFSGTVINSTYPINTDVIKLYARRVFKLNANLSGVPTASAVYPDGLNNGGMTMRRFKVNIPIKHKLLYNDLSNFVSNDGFFVAFGTINCDGSPSVSTDIRAYVSLEQIITYEDA